MLSVDYSQIEILIASLLCNEPALTEAVLNSDVHTYVASLVFGTPEDQVDKRHRKMAKAASFTLLFAGGLLGLIRSAALSGEPITAQDAERVRYGFYQAFPRVSQYLNGIRNTTAYRNDHNMGLSVRVPGGPVRFLYGETLTPSMVVNTLVQGTAAVGLKQALTMICDAGLGEYLCAVVHDEIVLDVPKFGATDIQKEVEQCMILGMEKILRKQPRVASTLGSRWGTSGVTHKEGEHVKQAK
jgi:DNA polymerase-1